MRSMLQSQDLTDFKNIMCVRISFTIGTLRIIIIVCTHIVPTQSYLQYNIYYYLFYCFALIIPSLWNSTHDVRVPL